MADSLLEKFLHVERLQGKAASTLRNHRRALESLLAHLEAKNLKQESVGLADLGAFIAQVRARYAPDHVNQFISAFRVYFRWLAEAKRKRSLADDLKFISAPARPVESLTTPEVTLILKYVRQYRRGMKKGAGLGRGNTRWARYRSAVFTCFLIETGLRVSEAVLLKVSDLNFNAASIRVYAPKTKTLRVLPISPTLRPILKNYLATRSSFFLQRNLFNYDNQWLFPAEHGGKWPKGSANRGVQSTARFAGIRRRVYCHMLRHTFAVHSLLKGCPETVLMRLGGWKKLSTLARYSGMNTEQLRQIHMQTSPLAAADEE